MLQRLNKYIIACGILLPGLAWAEQDFATIAETLTGGVNIIAVLLTAACVIIGIILIGTALGQYQIHRQNAKLVPLINPLLCLFLGMVLVILPIIVEYFDEDEEKKDAKIITVMIDIDAPL